MLKLVLLEILLTQFHDFLSARLPALFSQINQRGGQELHEVVAILETYKKQLQILKRVHGQSPDVVNLANALKRVFVQASTTLSLFSVLPGMGFQLKSVLKMEAVGFLLGFDMQDMCLEILKGSQESSKFCFAANGKTLSTWKSKFQDNRKRGGDSNRGGYSGNSKRGRGAAGGKGSGGPSRPHFSGGD